MNALKDNCIITHRLWVANGRQRNGILFDNKAKAKLLYRNTIKTRQSSEKSDITNSLHDALCSKDSSTFWKMWKNKFASSKARMDTIDDLRDEQLIADKFADMFSNEVVFDARVKHAAKVKLHERLKKYAGDNFDYNSITVEMVENIIRDMKRGKAAGSDHLTAEHLQLTHPILICTLTKLFNLMNIFGYVPNMFGHGTIIPIPKSDVNKLTIRVKITEASQSVQ